MNDFNGSSTASQGDTIQNLPWLIFTLCNNAYAIHSKYVTSILVPPDTITPIPDAPAVYRGLVNIRGSIFPVLDMRLLFHYPTLEKEREDFVEMMTQRENDHIEWADELKRCAEVGEHFGLTTDPHACKFGVWYDDFCRHKHNAEYSLNKIDEPHKLLHASAVKIEALQQTNTESSRAEIEEQLKLVTQSYVPEICDIIEEAKKNYGSYYRETMVLLSDGVTNLALVVDRVLAVDFITRVSGATAVSSLLNSKYFVDVARNDKIDKDILIIDEDKIIEKSANEVGSD